MTFAPEPDAAPARVGFYRPDVVRGVEAAAPDPALVERLRGVSGLSSAFSDELDRHALLTVVPAAALRPLRPTDVVIGRALTIRYLPQRLASGPAGLAHLTACEIARPGDVLVISSPLTSNASVLGGIAAAAIAEAGVAGVVVQGLVRDIDEIETVGLPVWATGHTPVTGRSRLVAQEINGPMEIHGVHVVAGDVVVADRSGVAFVPAELFAEVARAVLGE
jgi:4-hydroxy-4-methyl-2-oxoglutarate aldolase